MPSRLACIAILAYWSVAALSLFRRDLLPEFLVVSPPDLRTVASAEDESGPVRWAILVEPPQGDRANVGPKSVGQASTEVVHRPDGSSELTAKVLLEAGDLLRDTPFASQRGERLRIDSAYEIDGSGNLRSLEAEVGVVGEELSLLTLKGVVRDRAIEVTASGVVPMLNWKRSLYYEPRGMVQNALGPMDRLPGLQLGQRWESRVVSPLTGQVQAVRVEVARRKEIYWDNGLVSTLEVVTHLGPPLAPARTWVRADGLVLRQEVPFPFVRLILERQPRDPRRAEGAATNPRPAR